MNKPLNIAVQTHPNGYSLTIGNKEYFYFTLETLIQGIAYHAVDDFKQDANIETIASMINSHVTLLKHVRKETDKLLDTIANRDTTILALKEEICNLKKSKKGEASKE